MWIAVRLNRSQPHTDVSNMESKNKQNEQEACSGCLLPAAEPQGVSLKMDGICCVVAAALDLMVGFLIANFKFGPFAVLFVLLEISFFLLLPTRLK